MHIEEPSYLTLHIRTVFSALKYANQHSAMMPCRARHSAGARLREIRHKHGVQVDPVKAQLPITIHAAQLPDEARRCHHRAQDDITQHALQRSGTPITEAVQQGRDTHSLHF